MGLAKRWSVVITFIYTRIYSGIPQYDNAIEIYLAELKTCWELVNDLLSIVSYFKYDLLHKYDNTTWFTFAPANLQHLGYVRSVSGVCYVPEKRYILFFSVCNLDTLCNEETWARLLIIIQFHISLIWLNAGNCYKLQQIIAEREL